MQISRYMRVPLDEKAGKTFSLINFIASSKKVFKKKSDSGWKSEGVDLFNFHENSPKSASISQIKEWFWEFSNGCTMFEISLLLWQQNIYQLNHLLYLPLWSKRDDERSQFSNNAILRQSVLQSLLSVLVNCIDDTRMIYQQYICNRIL